MKKVEPEWCATFIGHCWGSSSNTIFNAPYAAQGATRQCIHCGQKQKLQWVMQPEQP